MSRYRTHASRNSRDRPKGSLQHCHHVVKTFPYFIESYVNCKQVPTKDVKLLTTLSAHADMFYQGQIKNLLGAIKVLNDSCCKTQEQIESLKKWLDSAQIKPPVLSSSSDSSQSSDLTKLIQQVQVKLHTHYEKEIKQLQTKLTYESKINSENIQQMGKMKYKLEKLEEIQKNLIYEGDKLKQQNSKQQCVIIKLENELNKREQRIIHYQQRLQVEKTNQQVNTDPFTLPSPQQQPPPQPDMSLSRFQKQNACLRNFIYGEMEIKKNHEQQKQKMFKEELQNLHRDYDHLNQKYHCETQKYQQWNGKMKIEIQRYKKLLQEQKDKFSKTITQLQKELYQQRNKNQYIKQQYDRFSWETKTESQRLTVKNQQNQQSLQLKIEQIALLKKQVETKQQIVQLLQTERNQSKAREVAALNKFEEVNKQRDKLIKDKDELHRSLELIKEETNKKQKKLVETSHILGSQIQRLGIIQTTSRLQYSPINQSPNQKENVRLLQEEIASLKVAIKNREQELKTYKNFYQNVERQYIKDKHEWTRMKKQLQEKNNRLDEQLKELGNKYTHREQQHSKQIKQMADKMLQRANSLQLKIQSLKQYYQLQINTFNEERVSYRRNYEESVKQYINQNQNLRHSLLTKISELKSFDHIREEHQVRQNYLNNEIKQIKQISDNVNQQLFQANSRIAEYQKQQYALEQKVSQLEDNLNGLHQFYYTQLVSKDRFIKQLDQQLKRVSPHNEATIKRQNTITSLFQSTQKIKITMTEYKNQSASKLKQTKQSYQNIISQLKREHQNHTQQLRLQIKQLIENNKKQAALFDPKWRKWNKIFKVACRFYGMLKSQNKGMAQFTESKKKIEENLRSIEKSLLPYSFHQNQDGNPIQEVQQNETNRPSLKPIDLQKMGLSTYFDCIQAVSQEKPNSKQRIANVRINISQKLQLTEEIQQVQFEQCEDHENDDSYVDQNDQNEDEAQNDDNYQDDQHNQESNEDDQQYSNYENQDQNQNQDQDESDGESDGEDESEGEGEGDDEDRDEGENENQNENQSENENMKENKNNYFNRKIGQTYQKRNFQQDNSQNDENVDNQNEDQDEVYVEQDKDEKNILQSNKNKKQSLTQKMTSTNPQFNNLQNIKNLQNVSRKQKYRRIQIRVEEPINKSNQCIKQKK